MKAYKGFNPDLTCRDFPYAEGGEYTHQGLVAMCHSGFHACPMPLDTLRYYRPGVSVYREVEIDDAAYQFRDKAVSPWIKIGEPLGLRDLIDAHVDLVTERASDDGATGEASIAATYQSTATASGDWAVAATTGDAATAATSGDRSTATASGLDSTAAASGGGSIAATSGGWAAAAASGGGSIAAASGYMSIAATSGYRSAAATSGNESTAATAGDRSTATASGDRSTAATSGEDSTASVAGAHSLAVAGGVLCRARGALGCWLILAERDHDGALLDVRAVRVDGETIKADVSYALLDGEIVEA